MKVRYDESVDTLTVELREGRIAESAEVKPGIILDFDDDGNLVSIELLDASKRVQDPRTVSLST